MYKISMRLTGAAVNIVQRRLNGGKTFHGTGSMEAYTSVEGLIELVH